MIVLNVGGGTSRDLPKDYKGWDQHILDIDASVAPDVLCDAKDMRKLKPGQYDAVFCCLPSQRVLTPKGPVSIGDVKTGDLVAGCSGWTRVLVAIKRHYCGGFVRIEGPHGILEVTDNHPIATPSGWLEAKQLRKGSQFVGVASKVQSANLVDSFDVFHAVPGFTAFRASGSIPVVESENALTKSNQNSSLLSLANKIWKQAHKQGMSVFGATSYDQHHWLFPSAIPSAVALDAMNRNSVLNDFTSALDDPSVAVGNAYLGRDGWAFADTQAKRALPIHESGQIGPFGVEHALNITRHRYDGDVYNLHTEDETFVVEGALTHNCSHNLEHFHKHEVPQVLQGFGHVLKPQGYAHIVVPDLSQLFDAITKGNHDIDDIWYRASKPISFHDVLYGWNLMLEQGNPYYAHKCGFTEKSLTKTLKRHFKHVFTATDDFGNLYAYAFKAKPTKEQLKCL